MLNQPNFIANNQREYYQKLIQANDFMQIDVAPNTP